MDGTTMGIMGIVVIVLGIIKKIIDIYYETKILPSSSFEEQEKYSEREEYRAKRGIYNTPFQKGRNQTTHEFNNFIIVIGIIFLVIGIIEILF